MNIYLVRHTEYYNPDNIFAFNLPLYLTKDGRAHAKRIAEWFKANNILELPIYTSPIMRTVQTSEIIASSTNSFVIADNNLRETDSIDLVGKPRGEKYWEIEPHDKTRENIEHVKERMVKTYLEKVNNKEECLLVSHGDPLTALYSYIAKTKLDSYLWYPENEMNAIQRGEIVKVTIENESVTFEKISV